MKDFVVCYGMTETSPVTFQGFTTDPMHLKTGTVGYPSNHQVNLHPNKTLVTLGSDRKWRSWIARVG